MDCTRVCLLLHCKWSSESVRNEWDFGRRPCRFVGERCFKNELEAFDYLASKINFVAGK